MKKIFIAVFAFLCIVCLSGCTSFSLQMTPSQTELYRQQMPVKFKFSTISWKTIGGLPLWFDEEKISLFISKLNERSPELFSNDDKAFPLTFSVEHKKVDKSNRFHALISLFTIFAVPWHWNEDHILVISAKIEDNKYVEKKTYVINERGYLWLIPFFTYFLPTQSNCFCHELIDSDAPINSEALQNAFLNMIYSLDKDKLWKMYEDRHGEPVQLLEGNQEQTGELLQD